MDLNDNFKLESIIYDYIDQFKSLFFEGKRTSTFLDFSKNEMLAVLFLYRRKNVNVSEIAEYINAPLNTATGVISRLEKKQIIERRRDNEDKRVVKIRLTDKGIELFESEKQIYTRYINELYRVLTDEEKKAAIGIVNKVIKVLNSEKEYKNEEIKEVKKIKRIIVE